MTASRSSLTETDIRTLVRGDNVDDRAVAAHKFCRRVEAGLPDEEREAAAEVLRFLAMDAAELVRRALAVTLKQSRNLPHDVALRLAQDVDSVASPILRFSPVFTDEDLAEIVAHADAVKQVAVARRERLSATVTTALVRHGCEPAVRTACANDNAEFTTEALNQAIDRFQDNEALAVAVAYRKALPPAIAERLVAQVSDQVRQHLINVHNLSAETALDLSLATRERATVDLVDQAGKTTDLKAFCAHLQRQGRLTASLLLRAVVQGQIRFFEWGVAELAGVPHHRAWVMVHDAGPLGLRAVYQKASLPEGLYSAFRAAVDTYHALQLEGGDLDLSQFQTRLMERFLTQSSGLESGDLDYLLSRLDRLVGVQTMQRRGVSA
jgi:uncharacterized protein (DUF2336 family)